jgi:flagellar hook-associated protein 2
MGRISTGIGLVSGINSKEIIDQLIALESRPKDILQSRIDTTNQRRLAYTDLSTRLVSLRLVGTKLKKPSQFEAATATSSNEDVLTATAANGAAIGSFQFQVARLVTSQQIMSRGFTDYDSAKVAAADTTITIEMGGGELNTQAPLSQLNGGAGVRRGLMRLTDCSGASAVIDITAAVTVDDVIRKINTSLDVSIRASISGDRIVLTDLSGGSGAMGVLDLADGDAAQDLGLASDTDAAAGTYTGSDINYVALGTTLNQINDGRGIRRASAGADMLVSFADSSSLSITLGPNVRTIGDVITTINAVDPAKLKAELTAGGNGIRLASLADAITVADVGDSHAATDLGVASAASGQTISGQPLLAGINSTLISSLNGGQGLSLGDLTITDRSGDSATIDLSAVRTVQELIDRINNEAGIAVTARLKASGNGIQITDDSGGTQDLVIADNATSQALGINGTFATTVASVQGKNLQRQWVSENSLLGSYNGGRGVSHGKFRITSSSGVSAVVDLTQGDEVTLGDVIREINSKGIGVTASVNANGDGLLLTDTAGGGLTMKVEDVEGTDAKDLNILGNAAGGVINGSFEKTIAVTAADTLTTLQTKINDLGFGVTANVINDGTGLTPFRLAVNARNTGRAGRVVFDASGTSLDTATLVEAQDAAVFLGGTEAPQPLLITASQNQLSGVVRGVTIDLHGVSNGPVTLNVTRSADALVEQLSSFTDTFNQMVDRIKELTKFDTETKQRGLLLGEGAIQKIETEVYAIFSSVVASSGGHRMLSDVGVRMGEGARLEFDQEKFRAAYASDADSVKALFTTPQQGITTGALLDLLNDGRGARTAGSGRDDFAARLRDGTTLNISLGAAETISEALSAINAADPAKLRAELAGSTIKLTDLTAGGTSFALTAVNGSQALEDLGLTNAAIAGTITGRSLGAVGDPRARGGGIAYVIESRISHLIDPLKGVITRENKTLDQRTEEFQDRIEQLDKLLEGKRLRLERQFAQMESILSSLQNQQQAIGQIQTIRLPERNRN